jgi:HSP20 family molecular chaperone IbpA
LFFLRKQNFSFIGLPDGADAKKLTNTLSADGILTIQIPVRDYRPPLTPTHQSQQFNLSTNIGSNDSYSVGDQQLKLTFDLSGYKPDDVSVKVNDNVLKGIIIIFNERFLF